MVQSDPSSWATRQRGPLEALKACVNYLPYPRLKSSYRGVPIYSNVAKLPRVPKLFGRSDTVEHLVDLVTDADHSHSSPTIALTGLAAIGKSSIVKAAVHSKGVNKHFGYRRYWIDCGPITGQDEFLDSFVRDLELTVGSESASTNNAKLNSIMDALHESHEPRLIVLDDLDTLWHSSSTFLSSFIHTIVSSIPSIRIIITIQGWGPTSPSSPVYPTHSIEIPPLSPSAAKTFFISICPKYDSSLDELLSKVGHAPLAIALLGRVGNTEGMSPKKLLDLLEQSGMGFLLDWSEEGTKSLRKSLDMSLGHYGDVLHLFGILSLLPGGVLRDELPTWAPNLASADITRMISVASTISLLTHQQTSSGRLQLPAPVQMLAISYHKLEPSSRTQIYTTFFAHAQLSKEWMHKPGEKRFHTMVKFFLDEKINIESILDHALSDGCTEAIRAVVSYSKPLCAIRPRVDIVRKAVALARSIGATSELAPVLQALGEVEFVRGFYIPSVAALSEAREIYRKCGDLGKEGECLHQCAVAEYRCEPSKGPGRMFDEACECFDLVGDGSGKARCLLDWAECLSSTPRSEGGRRNHDENALLDAAEAKFDEAFYLLSMLEDVDGSACCAVMTTSLFPLPRDVAIQMLEDARDTFRSNVNSVWLARALERLASCYPSNGDKIAAMREAIAVYEFLGNLLSCAIAKWRLSSLSGISDDEAVNLMQTSIPTFQDTRFFFHASECRLALGERLTRMSRFEDAIVILEVVRPSLTYRDDLVLKCMDLIAECLFETGQVSAVRGLVGDVVAFSGERGLGVPGCTRSILDVLEVEEGIGGGRIEGGEYREDNGLII